MAASDKWYFSKEQLEGTPSRKCGYDSLKELSYRQQAANFIQDMGQRLKVTQLCINTAIVYMHRFYVFHSFTNFPWHQMASAALFLAAKVEEQPRKLEYVIRVSNVCRNPKDTSFDITSEKYLLQSQDLVFNENVLLQTLGFDVAIDHPHTHVVRCCQLVRASKDLAQTSYFMASNSLHLTTMCLQYKPTVVACFCIHLACKWSNWEIPLSNEKKEWFSYVDHTVTAELLQQLTQEFLVIFESCPSRLKEKILAIGDNIPHNSGNHVNSLFDSDPKKVEAKDSHGHRPQHEGKLDDPHKYRSSRPHDPSSSREREYREKKERERLAAQQHNSKLASSSSSSSQKPPPHGHHRHPVDPNKYKSSSHSRPQSSGAVQVPPYPTNRAEPRDILREASRDSPFGLSSSRDSHHGKEIVRDPQQVRSEREKRDYLLKHSNEINSSSSKYPPGYVADKHRHSNVDPNRPPRLLDHNKVPSNKQDQVRRTQEEGKSFLRNETDSIKRHLNVNSSHVKPIHSTSQKVILDPLKTSSVPKQSSSSSSQYKSEVRSHYHNGNNSGSSYDSNYANPNLAIEPERIKTSVKLGPKDEIPTPPVVKRPSLFSPEKTPPQQHSTSLKTQTTIEKEDLRSPSIAPIGFMPPAESPVGRTRNYSSSSEPELRPVLKKIDQVEGFENLMRDSSIGIKKLQQTPDLISPVHEDKTIAPILNDNKINMSVPLVNGMETNPALIRNLLKETPSIPQLSTVTQPLESRNASEVVLNTDDIKKERDRHHKSKKKNKEKHKHKDKDREKEKDKEKKKKHKDKDRYKHKHKDKQNSTAVEVPSVSVEPKPLVIKIQKDKIQPVPSESAANSPPSLKIKIPKDKIKTEHVGELPQSVVQPTTIGPLKIKISKKDVINNCSSSGDSSSRKREREKISHDGPPAKVSKSSVKEKQNGRHAYNKVHLGDSELSQNRLAESKYTKTSSS
ncbi:hypothetical protein WA026_002332 [Henosepilachna vigintioctopunctata]|uniref:Cyclin-like domain-containing protein n=1 Tax=Henosepilachna vigintioctopunctata TaxID=420089 RepID=A0AAW1TUL5_9CUCU